MTLLDLYRNPEIEPERVPAPHHDPRRDCAATGTRLPLQAQLYARDIRHRLRNPANAVKDAGIDLRRHRPPKRDLCRPWQAPWIFDITPKKFQFSVDCPRSISKIIEIVCEKYKRTPEDILGCTRRKKPSDARHIAMWLTVKTTDYTMHDIAKHFCRADHSVTYFAVHKINARRQSNRQFGDELDLLIEMVKS